MTPSLAPVTFDGVTFLADVALFSQTGIRIAFSQRHGGVSDPPFTSLNLGAHTGDNLEHVEENRQRFYRAVGLSDNAASRVNSAGQVHGICVQEAGEVACELPGTDALVTAQEDAALLLCFADCVPIIVVEPHARAISVIHSGWRGTLGEIAKESVQKLQQLYSADPSQMLVYIGPYIGLQKFTISHEIGEQFFNKFDTFSHSTYCVNEDESVNLDLGIAVAETVVKMGVRACNIVNSHIDTVSSVGDFFSYRAEDRLTGRHGALACICSSP